jgi:NAD(P)-dependent dehydrogenase (short-subunit alcohol dehydrogenase family)
MSADFAGHGVVVTGAAQGIGASIAGYFVARQATVVLMDIDGDLAAQTAAALGGGAHAVAGDVSRRADVRRAVGACAERAGHVDVMVAHAGIASVQPLLDVTDEQWQRIFDVNVYGVFLCAQEAGRAMRGRGGSIVVTASTNAVQVEENLVGYSASKGAVVTFVRAAALDLARHGIRINAVAPGVVNTRIARWVIDDPVLGPKYLKKIPLGRFAEPDDVARVVGFLAGPDSGYITGQTIVLDGGQTLGIPLDPADAGPSAGPGSQP